MTVAACGLSFFCQIIAVDVDTSRITVQLHLSEEVSLQTHNVHLRLQVFLFNSYNEKHCKCTSEIKTVYIIILETDLGCNIIFFSCMVVIECVHRQANNK